MKASRRTFNDTCVIYRRKIVLEISRLHLDEEWSFTWFNHVIGDFDAIEHFGPWSRWRTRMTTYSSITDFIWPDLIFFRYPGKICNSTRTPPCCSSHFAHLLHDFTHNFPVPQFLINQPVSPEYSDKYTVMQLLSQAIKYSLSTYRLLYNVSRKITEQMSLI